jgi:hypothetical protein
MNKRILETTLKAYQIRRPFKPFLVELTSGSIIEVRHPEGLVSYSGAAVYIDSEGSITIFDAAGVARFSDRPARRASA